VGFLEVIDQSIRAENESSPPGPMDDFWYNDIGESLESDSGIRITPQSAKTISTVWKALNWWFRIYGTLPHKLYERATLLGKPAAIEAVDHPLYDIIHSAPNPGMTAADFHGFIPVDKRTWGNFYAFIQRNTFGKPVALWRIRPDYVTPKMKGRQFLYEIRGDDGLPKPFFPDEILHLPAISNDGRVGLSAVRANHNVLGWNRATVRYGGQFFNNASRPSGIISLNSPIKDKEVKKELVDNMRRSGKEAGKLLLIEGAATFTKMTLDQDEAQFILTHNLQEEDLCGIFDVFPHEVGITRNSNNSITEQLTINTVTRHLTPECVRNEQGMNLQLLSDIPSSGRGGGTERSRYFFQSEIKSLMRGDTAAQVAFLKAMRDLGIYNGDQIADFIGEQPYEGGDTRVINGAYVPLDMLREIAKRRKPGDVGAPNGPGGDPPTENKRDAAIPSKFVEVAARVRESYSFLFADAVGRVISRKKPQERAKYTPIAFRPVLSGLTHALGVKASTDFMDRYLAALSERSAVWESEAVSSEELGRAMDALIEHGKTLEYFEGRVCDA